MLTSRSHLLAALLVVFTQVAVRPASADEMVPDTSHLRVLSGKLQDIIGASQQSVTLQSLIADLDRSDVIAYVRCGVVGHMTVEGRLTFIGAAPPFRYVLIELACPRVWSVQAVTLAHELRHAAEVASDSSVIDKRSFKRLYERIGFIVSDDWSSQRFESYGAMDTGRQVRREITDATALKSTVTSDTSKEPR